MSGRGERVALQLRRELAELVRVGVKDPRVQSAALVTITHVAVSDDLSLARVLVSVVGGDEPRGVIKGLAKAAGFLRGELGRRMRTKKVPELRFFLDETEERAARIDALLDEIREQRAHDAGGTGEASARPPDAAATGDDSSDERADADDESDDDQDEDEGGDESEEDERDAEP